MISFIFVFFFSQYEESIRRLSFDTHTVSIHPPKIIFGHFATITTTAEGFLKKKFSNFK